MSYGDLKGKTFVVTGAAAGQGRATALLLARQGANLGLLDLRSSQDVVDEVTRIGTQAVAFEVDVSTAIQLGDKVADVSAALHRLGCPMVLDDFGMRTECFDLLRLPAVRYVKIASEITAKMRSDKLSQAAITAVVQMARVLGMHTVAKRTETAAEQEWLTALGVDFIQSNALSPPVAIESLSTVQKPPPSALTK